MYAVLTASRRDSCTLFANCSPDMLSTATSRSSELRPRTSAAVTATDATLRGALSRTQPPAIRTQVPSWKCSTEPSRIRKTARSFSEICSDVVASFRLDMAAEPGSEGLASMLPREIAQPESRQKHSRSEAPPDLSAKAKKSPKELRGLSSQKTHIVKKSYKIPTLRLTMSMLHVKHRERHTTKGEKKENGEVFLSCR